MSQENDFQHIIKCAQNRIGMTVREEIASRVLAGALSGQYQNTFSSDKELIAAVIRATDDLIKELERTKKWIS